MRRIGKPSACSHSSISATSAVVVPRCEISIVSPTQLAHTILAASTSDCRSGGTADSPQNRPDTSGRLVTAWLPDDTVITLPNTRASPWSEGRSADLAMSTIESRFSSRSQMPSSKMNVSSNRS